MWPSPKPLLILVFKDLFAVCCRDDSEEDDTDETGCRQLIYEQVCVVFVLSLLIKLSRIDFLWWYRK